jgi:hypothetical protein
MNAADALEKLIPYAKYHLVTENEASKLVRVDNEWWLISVRRSDKEGRIVR